MSDDPTPDTWTTKEVIADLKSDLVDHLNKQDGALADISKKVDTKADKADLFVLSQKIDGQGARITKLEDYRTEETAIRKSRLRLWATAGAAAGIAATLAGSLIESHII